MRCAVVLLVLVRISFGQDTPDDLIRKDYQRVMELASAPAQGEKLDEEKAKARSELFRKGLEDLVRSWRSRASELDFGRFHLGRSLSVLGKPDEAVPFLKSFVEAHPDGSDAEDALLLLGSAYLDTNDLSGSVLIFEAFMKDRPKSDQRMNAVFYLGIARSLQGRREDALPHFKTVIESGGDSPMVGDAHLKTVETLRDLGRLDEARAYLDQLLKDQPDAPALLALKEQLDWYGKEAPELANVDAWLQGTAGTLQARRGRVVVLNFFADRYEACQAELQTITGLAQKFTGKPVDFIALTAYYRPKDKVTPEVEQGILRKFIADKGVTAAIAVSRDFINLKNYGVRGIPYTVVISKDGRIVHVKTGASRRNQTAVADLQAAIERAAS